MPAAECLLFGLRFGIDVRLVVQRGAETRLIAGEESSGGCRLGSKAGACACRWCAEILNQVAPQAAPSVAN